MSLISFTLINTKLKVNINIQVLRIIKIIKNQIKMAFMPPTVVNSNDEYNTDIKLDPSIALSESASSLKWVNFPNMPLFAGTFWDKSVRIFEVTQTPNGPGIIQKFATGLNTVPISCCWNADCSALYVGNMDGTIKIIDINTQNVTDIGKHNGGVANLHYIPQQNLLISSAYQNNIHFWQGGPNPVLSVDVLNKVFVSDFKNGILVGGTANEKIFIIDMNTVSSGTKTILDSVDLGKFSQIQSIAIDDKAQTVGMATVDGRANISSLSRLQNGFKLNSIITFKANKLQEAGSVILFPVNSVGFNSVYENWFLTAGSDGVMSFWDYKARNKIKSFNYASNPVCCSSVSSSGNMVAYANGNDWHLGQEGIGKWSNRIGVHLVTDLETKFMGNSSSKK